MQCFDMEYHFEAADIEPMITYGTNPGMGIGVNGSIPTGDSLKRIGPHFI